MAAFAQGAAGVDQVGFCAVRGKTHFPAKPLALPAVPLDSAWVSCMLTSREAR